VAASRPVAPLVRWIAPVERMKWQSGGKDRFYNQKV
jgi:hypothetical protein